MKPRRTPTALLDRLAKRVEELGEERHREALQRLAPVERFACEEHMWHPPGPGTLNMDALAGLCPLCYAKRRQAQREQEQPESRTVELNRHQGSLYAQRAWEQHCEVRMAEGEVLPDTPAERESLRWIDNARAEELYDLKETPQDRSRRNAAHWGRRLGVYTRQRYEPHPARAGQ